MPWHEPVERLEASVSGIEEKLSQQIETHINFIDLKLEKLQFQLFWRWILAVVGILIALGGVYFAARHASQVAHQVEVERHRTIYFECHQQNLRNQSTLRVLQLQTQHFEQLNPRQKAQIQKTYQFEVILIDKLQPNSDCQRLAQLEAPIH